MSSPEGKANQNSSIIRVLLVCLVCMDLEDLRKTLVLSLLSLRKRGVKEDFISCK